MTTTPDRATSQSSRQTDPTTDPLVSETSSGAPEQLSLLDDAYTQDLLITLCDGPRGGRELAAACEASRPTVYRRVNKLEEAGLLTAETRVDPDGHHCKVFRLVRDRLLVTIEDGTITVTACPTTDESGHVDN